MQATNLIKTLLLGTSCLLSTSSFAADAQFTPSQKSEIQTIVRDYLVQNPQILVEVSQVLQKKQEQQVQEHAKQAIKDNSQKLFASANSPVIGNAKGTISVVEFFDYQCSHCKAEAPAIDALIKANPQVKVILKELPIFGKISNFAARAALASQSQGKYLAFHQALLKSDQALTEESVMQIAKQVGLNTTTLKEAMKKPELDAELKQNYELANAMGIIGTPSLIVAMPDKQPLDAVFVPGAASEADLQAIIQKLGKK